MSLSNLRKAARIKRKKSIRKRLIGTQLRPRLCVFRSSKHTYAQVVDDTCGHTVATASSMEKLFKERPGFDNKVGLASFVGELIGQRAIEKGIKTVVFDRNGFLYHGRVKAVAEGARKAGLDF